MSAAQQPIDERDQEPRPWSMHEPVVRRLAAAGLKLPTVLAPLDFPEPPDPEGEGQTLTEILIADRGARR